MAKANVVTITLPHNVTVKADKLTDRTVRTLKVGDYIVSSLTVRGVICYFYTRVISVTGSRVSTAFGSQDKTHNLDIVKGAKFPVFRPTSA